MSSKPETVFYTGVHRYLPTDLHREKMCNPYRGGTWDFWFSGTHDLWIEYKFVVLPKRDSTMVDVTLSDLQIDWGKSRYQEGRSIAVIVGCKEGGIILTDREWEQSFTCEEFRARIISRTDLAQWIVNATGE